ncbi:mitochondrial folate transporter/carrier [Musca domestica]|uniref:Mitochondrial folate transporter/carrier n=1 Tax=Musca domestica TaxID=7370 RepID=A0ABM3VLS8_MUSDO|nr:mitochondrial folate transporter/carrier [Musca domestica]
MSAAMSPAKPTNGAAAAATASSTNGKFKLATHVKYEHLVAGISGGVTSTLILHPLDLIKIRFAVNDGRTAAVPQYRGLGSAFATIFRQEGFRGLYKGVTPNVWGSGSSWGLYFMFYNTIKTFIQGGNATLPLGPSMHMLAAAQSGALTLVLTNPIWVVKTRLCLQYGGADGKSAEYRGMVHALAQIYKEEGIRGLYKGFVPGMLGVSHGAIQFMTYEEMKNCYNEYRKLPIDTKLATSEYLAFAAISKLIAAAATYPYQVVRARLQDHHHSYQGTWDCIKQTWSFEGARGFYKGLQASLYRVVPATMITFVVYENVSYYLLQRSKEKKLA